MKYFLQTYGCQANKADSELIAGTLEAMGHREVKTMERADLIILNTCSIRQSAEDRVFAKMEKLRALKEKKPSLKIVIAGCMIGPSGKDPRDKKITERLDGADAFIGTQDYPNLNHIFRQILPEPVEYLPNTIKPKRTDKHHAYVLISSGCNNFCTFCIVPFARGREVSRPFRDIVDEVRDLIAHGYKEVTLLGQNVNSYGSDLVKVKGNIRLPTGRVVRPVYVKHLGRYRIPTLFPFLLETVAQIPGLQKVDFISSNPWDFSDELIDIIARNQVIARHIHLPIQAGSNRILKRMNRWYTREQYARLVKKIHDRVPDVTFSTDIIVGFPGETEKDFDKTVDIAKKVGWTIAYIAEYSPRPGTVSGRLFKDDISNWEKKRRFRVLDEIINGHKHPPAKIPRHIQYRHAELVSASV
ncbi:MAG: MiaB/RimO family radical SAM methylthiotransferase [bacterium]|nr:MiaB/RimO family radical SAM methylthiotransferase [bacterium]